VTANPVRGEAPLSLPGRDLILVMDMEALISAEATYGKPMDKMMADAKAGFVGATRAMLLGALSAYHPSITKQEALQMLQDHPKEVGAAMNLAGERAWPDPEKKAVATTEGKEGPNPPLPGKNSGVAGVKRASTRKRSSGKPLAPTS
jgi:hypothetical protein